MTENKRFWILNTLTEYSGIKDKDKLLTFNEVVDLLNEFYKENKELQFQCNQLQEGAHEFYRAARENANRVGQLKKENKELKEENEKLKMHMNSAKAYLEGGHTKKAIERLKIIDVR